MSDTDITTDLASVIAAIRRHEGAIRDLGVTALFLYGSRARGDHRPDSDIDVMVDYQPDSLSIVDLLSIKHRIEDDTGLEVHISTRDSYPPAKRYRFEHDLVRVL
jgi:predicted nucleotidyltransferase